MDTPAVAALKAAVSSDNVWLERATIAVFVGVVIELVELLLFNKELSLLNRGILFVATLLVVAGCGGEWVFEHDLAQKEARLQQISDQEVGALKAAEAADNKIATQAARDAGHLGVTVGGLKTFVQKEDTRIAQVRGDATAAVTKLNKDRADLEKARDDALAAADAVKKQYSSLKADVEARKNRRITPDMRKQIVAWLKPIAVKPKIVVSALMTDGEALRFADDLADTLKEAGYTVTRPDFAHSLISISVTGLIMEVRDAKKPPAGAGALQHALRNEGFAPTAEQDGAIADDDTVVLVVSTHD